MKDQFLCLRFVTLTPYQCLMTPCRCLPKSEEFSDNAGDNLNAVAWLAERDIDTAPPHAA